MNRLTRTMENYRAILPLLQCPLCQTGLVLQENSLICENRHTFNFSRKGYCDFASGAASSAYEKPLWESRRTVFEEGFFAPLTELLLRLLPRETPCFALDAGCGEGSLTATLSKASGGGWLGLDLSREGIALAGCIQSDQCWAAADLTCIPVRSHTADILLNCLSPARYDEFARVLRPNGRLIKVMPGKRHLCELRDCWTGRREGGEPALPDHPAFAETERHTVEHTVCLCQYVEAIAQMTPLGWHRQGAILKEPMDVTLSLEVVVLTRLRNPKLL